MTPERPDVVESLAPLMGIPGVPEAAQEFLVAVGPRPRPAGRPGEISDGLPAPIGAQADVGLELTRIFASLGLVPLPHQVFDAIDAARAAHPEIQLPNYLGPAIVFLTKTVQGIVRAVMGEERARRIDVSGDLVLFVASVSDTIGLEDVLREGPLDFAGVLRVKDQLEGMHVLLILASFLFHVLIEAVSLGILGASAGLLLNLVDRIIGDRASILQAQLVRRAVAEPLTKGFARIHRHGEISEADAELAFSQGLIDEDRLVDVYVSAGLSDQGIQERVMVARIKALQTTGVQAIRTKFVPRAVLEKATLSGILTDEEYIRELARQGFDDEALAIFWALISKKIPAPPGA